MQNAIRRLVFGVLRVTAVVGASVAVADSGSARQKEPDAGTLRLKAVSYSGPKYRAVRRDDGTANYGAPHWEDRSTPPDGDALDQGDRKFPVSYTRSTEVKVSARWEVNPPANFQNCLIRGKGRDGMNVPQTPATLKGNVLSIPAVTLTRPLPATIRFYNEFTIRWEASLNGGKTWVPAGNSGNRMYVTLADPVSDAAPFETVLEIGARNADGQSDAADAVARIWNDFKIPFPGVKRKVRDGYNRPDDKEMTYWGTPGTACLTMEQMLASASGDGKCEAWARLLQRVLQNLGVSGPKVLQVTSIYQNDSKVVTTPTGDPRGGMYIQIWTAINPTAAAANCAPFTYVFGPKFTDQQGMPGQGNFNPVSTFLEHFIVEYGGKYYDPSYGGSPRMSQEEWENVSISYFSKGCLTSTGALIVMKENTPGVETVFTAVP